MLCLVVNLLCLITCCYLTCTLQDGESPLHRAAEGGNASIVNMLLEAGMPVDIKDKVSMCC